jgi:hypothetical protein
LIGLSAATVITPGVNMAVMGSKAQATVDTYYNDLRVGFSREEENHYWTVKRAKRFNAMVNRMSNTTGVDPSRWARRIRDIATLQARCENMPLMASDTSDYFVKKPLYSIVLIQSSRIGSMYQSVKLN